MFQLDLKSSRSIYEQIIENIKELIMKDILAEGDKLPSVRELSRQLTINPNTVQKAFKELDREGYIYTVSGKGTFISPKNEIRVDQTRIDKALEHVTDSFKELLYLGISPDKAKALTMDAIDALLDEAGGAASETDRKEAGS